MESFKGNGAECMVQFIKDGCKGFVYADPVNANFPIMNRNIWAQRWGQQFTADIFGSACTYYPPEPVYRNASPGEALDAWLNGKEVQRHAATIDEAIADGEWATLIPDGQHGRPHLWQAHHIYRIKEE